MDNDPVSEDYHTVSEIQFGSGFQFQPNRAFNDRDEVAFVANFDDGTSGVMIANVNAIPEPTAAAMFVLGFITMSTPATRCRRGRRIRMKKSIR